MWEARRGLCHYRRLCHDQEQVSAKSKEKLEINVVMMTKVGDEAGVFKEHASIDIRELLIAS